MTEQVEKGFMHFILHKLTTTGIPDKQTEQSLKPGGANTHHKWEGRDAENLNHHGTSRNSGIMIFLFKIAKGNHRKTKI